MVAALRELPGSFVIDGEAVAHCPEGLPDYHPAPLGAMVSAPGVGDGQCSTACGTKTIARRGAIAECVRPRAGRISA